MLWRRPLRDWLKGYSKDVPQRFEDEAEVSTVFKRSLQSDDMLFVIWIGLVKLIQHLYFLETRFVPKERNQGGLMHVKRQAHIDSWHLTILIATSLPTSVGSPPIILARTTLANIPLPREEKTW